MEELTILNEKGAVLSGNADFGVVDAGKPKELSMVLRNNIQYPINAYISIFGDDDVKLKNAEVEIPPKDSKRVLLTVTPLATRMRPIRFSIQVKYDYLIK